jgi:hypothetical protein
MAFNHDTKSKTYFTISHRHINPNGKNYTMAEKRILRDQLRNEGFGFKPFKSREDAIEALSKTALDSDLFVVSETASLGIFTL